MVSKFLKGIGCGSEDWIHLTHDRVQWRDFVDTVMNLRVLKGSGYFLDQLSDHQVLNSYMFCLWSAMFWMAAILTD